MEQQYYDGTQLLSMKDLDGNVPEIFMVTTNRTGGKTTYYSRLCVNRFLNKKIRKFGLIYRFKDELDDVAEKFFKDIGTLFFSGHELESEPRDNGHFHELFLDGISCGYALPLNCADSIKKMSHFFSDVDLLYFDEFQSETNHYCSDEVKKFISVHTSIARGQGKQVRYVPVIMVGNPVTLLNPYYLEMGIAERLSTKTKFLRGHGFVLEQGYNESASNAQKESGFNKAFSGNAYVDYGAQGVYLNDNKSFIENPTGHSRYVCTLRYNGRDYGVREYYEQGIMYCGTSVDETFPLRISVTTEDFKINYIMLKRNDFVLADFKFYFKNGCFRFKNLQCKEALIKSISY